MMSVQESNPLQLKKEKTQGTSITIICWILVAICNTSLVSYSKATQRRAINMHVINGDNAEQIAAILKAEHPKITSNTIRTWLEKQDEATGTSPQEDRLLIESQARNSALKDAEISLTSIKIDTVKAFRSLKRQVFDEEGNLKVQFKSGEGAWNTFRGLMNDMEKMLEKERERLEPEEIAKGINRAIRKTAKLSKFLDSNPDVFRQFFQNLKLEITISKNLDIAFIEENSEREG